MESGHGGLSKQDGRLASVEVVGFVEDVCSLVTLMVQCTISCALCTNGNVHSKVAQETVHSHAQASMLSKHLVTG